MIIVRTAFESDIEGILELAKRAFPGMTTLPPERDVLLSKLRNSEASVRKCVTEPFDESYFLVMEDINSNQVIGTAAVIARLGTKDEFYSYKLNRVSQSSKELDKRVSVQTLNLSNHFEGFAEVATLYLDENFRKNGNGSLLAKTRYLFMAQFRDRFPEAVMADLRGYFDENGNSPFWNAVGRHFFEMDFAEADLYGAIHGNQFIADLMPKHPIYVNMLPAEAQDVVGRCNVVGKPAMKMLESEGFRWNGHVDIFDAAPSVDTKIDDIAAIKNSQIAELIGLSEHEGDQQAYVVTNQIESFRCCSTTISIEKGGVRLPRSTIKALDLELGDSVRYLVLQVEPKK